MFDPTNSLNRKPMLGFDPNVEPLDKQAARDRRDGMITVSLTVSTKSYAEKLAKVIRGIEALQSGDLEVF